MKTEKLPHLTLCLNTHNEGAHVAATIRSFMAAYSGPFSVAILADETTDGSCDDLGPPCQCDAEPEHTAGERETWTCPACGRSTVIFRTPKRIGCGRAKGLLLREAPGDVLLHADAHCRVLRGRLDEMIREAAGAVAVFCPGVAPLHCAPDEQPGASHPIRDVSWGASMPCQPYGVDQDHLHRHSGKKPKGPTARRTAPYNAVFAMSRRTAARLGGWNAYPGRWGSQEIGLALRAWFADVPILAWRDCVVGHWYKRKADFVLRTSERKANRMYAHMVVFDPKTVADRWIPVWNDLQATRNGWKLIEGSEISGQAKHFQRNCKRRTDAEFFAKFYGHAAPSVPLPLSQITAVLLNYRRPRGIKRAVRNLRALGVPTVWAWSQSGAPALPDGVDRVFTDSANAATWARYCIAPLVETPWVLFLDDDIELRERGLTALRQAAVRHPGAILGLHGMRLEAPFDNYGKRTILDSSKVRTDTQADMVWPKGQLLPRDVARDLFARRDLWDLMRGAVGSTSGDDLTAAVAAGIAGVETFVVPTDGRAWVEHPEHSSAALSAQPGRMRKKRRTVRKFRARGWVPVAAREGDAHNPADVRWLEANRLGAPVVQHQDEVRRLWHAVAKQRPKVFVELGSHSGGALYMLAGACERAAKVIAVDLGLYQHRRVRLRKIIARLRRDGYDAHWVRGDCHDPAVVAHVRDLADGPIDFLHVDADHRVSSVRADWAAYRPHLSADALVAFHDIRTPHVGVKDAWPEIRRAGRYQEIVTDSLGPQQKPTGIGILWPNRPPLAPVCVYTPFGPGRPWSVDLWEQSVTAARIPTGAQFVVVDNTSEPETTKLLRHAFERVCVAHHALGSQFLTLRKPPLAEHKNPAVSIRCAELWKLARPHFHAEAVLSLESDIGVPPDTYARLLDWLGLNATVKAVAAACRSRREDRHELAYQLKSLDPWRRMPKSLGLSQVGLQQVGACHTGCTLFDAEALLATEPRPGPRNAAADEWGCDFAICQDLQLAGGRILIDWDLRVRHHLTARESV